MLRVHHRDKASSNSIIDLRMLDGVFHHLLATCLDWAHRIFTKILPL